MASDQRTDDPFEPAPAIEAHLEAWAAAQHLPANLLAAIRYSFLGAGKRLRPLLAWRSAQAVGGDGRAGLDAGLAVELVHCFSLVHDDLPAMDNDDLRRGKPTLHIHAGEALAVLAGDAMLSLAFGSIVERTADPQLAVALGRELALGTSSMIAGQVYDTLGELPAGLSAIDRVKLIHDKKTGALITASCRMGAMLGLASISRPWQAARELAAITRFADAMGLMFQVVDDLIDVEQTSEHTGKRTSKDHQAGKLTYPGAMGVAESKAEVAHLLAAAIEALTPLGSPADPLRQLARFLSVRTK